MDKRKLFVKILAGFLLLMMIFPICATVIISILNR